MNEAEKEMAENGQEYADVLVRKLDYMLDVFVVLLRAGASPKQNSSWGKSPLLDACGSMWRSGPSSHTGRVFNFLLKEGVSMAGSPSPLATAAKSFSLWKVERLLGIHGSGDVTEALEAAVRAMVHCSCPLVH